MRLILLTQTERDAINKFLETGKACVTIYKIRNDLKNGSVVADMDLINKMNEKWEKIKNGC